MRCLLLLPILALGACQDGTGPNSQSDALRGLPRALTSAEQDALTASTRFGLDLFRTVSRARPGQNVVLSPLSASFALGMALNGAGSATRDSMRAVLGWGNRSDQEINDAYRGLATLLPSLDPKVQFTSANSIWIDQSFPVLAPFVNTNRSYFGAQVQNLDFRSASAPGIINQWVSRATNDRIPHLVDAIDADEVLLLVNAIWFKGSWRERFEAAHTQSGWFHNAAGDSTLVPMMSRHGRVRLLSGPTWSGGEQAYGNGAYSLLILMPFGSATVERLADSLTSATWANATRDTSYRTLDVSMPRFTLADDNSLKDALTSLGMGIAFSDGADFSRIANAALTISRVQQKSWLDVNEEGTEAAAATVVGMGTTSSAPVSFVVDRPFVFAIRERFSGAILFIGKVAKL